MNFMGKCANNKKMAQWNLNIELGKPLSIQKMENKQLWQNHVYFNIVSKY